MQVVAPQLHQREGLEVRRGLAEPGLALVHGVVAAVRHRHLRDELPHLGGDLGEFLGVRVLLGDVPQPYGDVGHGEVVEEVEVERVQRGIQARGLDQPAREVVDLRGDRVVLLAEGDQLAQLVLEQPRLLAHRDQLALADRDRAPAVRVRDLQVHEDVDVVLEETGVLLEEIGDLFGGGQRGVLHRSGISSTPSNTRTASPVMITGA
jgi:hypothetical protein